MFERYTARARAIVVFAQEHARQNSNDYIGTEHLLLALAKSEGSVPHQILASANYDASKILARINKGREQPDGHIPFTPRAKKVLELAVREALAHGSVDVDDIDILLGILRQRDGNKAVSILQEYGGVDAVNSLRNAITLRLARASTARVETPPKEEEYAVIKLPIPKAIAAISDDRVGLLKQIVRRLTGFTSDDMQKILRIVELPANERQQLLDSTS